MEIPLKKEKRNEFFDLWLKCLGDLILKLLIKK